MEKLLLKTLAYLDDRLNKCYINCMFYQSKTDSFQKKKKKLKIKLFK